MLCYAVRFCNLGIVMQLCDMMLLQTMLLRVAQYAVPDDTLRSDNICDSLEKMRCYAMLFAIYMHALEI